MFIFPLDLLFPFLVGIIPSLNSTGRIDWVGLEILDSGERSLHTSSYHLSNVDCFRREAKGQHWAFRIVWSAGSTGLELSKSIVNRISACRYILPYLIVCQQDDLVTPLVLDHARRWHDVKRCMSEGIAVHLT